MKPEPPNPELETRNPAPVRRPRHFTNPEPRTWACECGQMNLLTDRTCFSCAGDRDECWDPDDRQSQRGRF